MSNASAGNAAAPIFDADALTGQTQGLVTASIAWFHTHWLQILIAVAIGATIVIALHSARRFAGRLAARDPDGRAGWFSIIGRALVRTNNFFILMLSIKLVVGYAGAPDQIGTTVNFLWTIASVFQAAIWVREIVLGAIEHRTQAQNYQGEALLSAMGLIRLLVTFALFAIALVVVLDNLGVNVTGLVAGLGVGGIAIGLAAQGIFADLFAALAIIFDRPFRRGDKVQYDQTLGVIEGIGLKSTRIRSFGGEIRIISNRQLLDKEIQNISNRDHIRVTLTIGVAYETPPDTLERVPQMLREVFEEAGGTVARASFESFGASSLDFVVQFDVPGDDWPTAHATRDKAMVGVIRRFAAEKISIPYPTQTTYTAAPDGTLVMPYAQVQPVQIDRSLAS
ncbi:mechanosensitive ion channel family protein [Sphingomonas rubra]|uniref:Small-conductance mechanosensitive channel n=1 Tax=Sphingomonas rubra TaxID=634430 RepID=A0A1I5T7N6_9SPHN|nr:mechanosensitive ion channel family protein [Sphingomonas rubra]SFP79050.1 Small-conductance mechanosensitive channel [Sphingomonas rubra]